MIIDFIILVIVLINTFGSMGEGSMGSAIGTTAMMAIFISYLENTNTDWNNISMNTNWINIKSNANWFDIGANASKLFISLIAGCLILGFVVYYTFYIKEEISEWMNKRKSKQ